LLMEGAKFTISMQLLLLERWHPLPGEGSA